MIEIAKIDDDYRKRMLDAAQNYADKNSTCCKVKVGSVIVVPDLQVYVYGCNHGVHNCTMRGCRRVMLYGEASKSHRLPSDCDSIHSEVDAIGKAAKNGWKLDGATIYVSRYPCENCARAIVAAGIKKVIYGRKEGISDYTKQILDSGDVKVIKVEDWEREDNNE